MAISRRNVYGYFTSHPVHVGRHVAGVLCGPESEISVLVVTVVLVVFGRHRHEGFSSSNYANVLADTSHLSTESTLRGVTPSCLFVPRSTKKKDRAGYPISCLHRLVPAYNVTLNNPRECRQARENPTLDSAHVFVTVTNIVSGRCTVHTGTPPFSFCRAGYIYDQAKLPAPLYRSWVHSDSSKPACIRNSTETYDLKLYAVVRSFQPTAKTYFSEFSVENARSGRYNPVNEYHKTRPRIGYYQDPTIARSRERLRYPIEKWGVVRR